VVRGAKEGRLNVMSLRFEPRVAKLFVIEDREDVIPFIIRIKGVKTSKARSLYLVALDSSWSMDGAKIFFAKEAIIQMIGSLDPEDYIVVYSFCGKVSKIVAMKKIENVEEMAKQVADVRLCGGTNIYKVLEHMLEDTVQLNTINRNGEAGRHIDSVKMILVTDGNPTVGIKDENRIIEMAERVGKNISLSLVVGIGKDYNERLLMGIASKTNGVFEHLSDPTKMPVLIEKMMAKYRELSAKNVKLFIRPAPGIGVFVYNRPAYNVKGGVEIEVGDVYGDEEISVVGELILPPQKRGMVFLATITASYDDAEGKHVETEVTSLSIPCIRSVSPEDVEVDERVFKEVNLVRIATALAKDVYGELSADKLEKLVEELANMTLTIDRRDLYSRTIDLKSQLEKEGLSQDVVKKIIALISKILSGRYE